MNVTYCTEIIMLQKLDLSKIWFNIPMHRLMFILIESSNCMILDILEYQQEKG